MRWRGEAQSTNVEDRRHLGGPAIAVGGGGMLLLMLIAMFLGVDPRKINLPAPGPGAPNIRGEQRELTPEEVDQKDFAATVLRFTEVVWDEQFKKAGEIYQPPRVVLFSEAVETGCGVAPSAVGPFYCPRDQTVYLDPSFFEELENRLGGSKAEFSQAYVLAHEIGHHVQNLLGFSDLVERKRNTAEFNEWSVRLELQADYLAGVWAHYGQERFNFIEPGDVEAAMTSANAIGDDRIQRRTMGFTSPEQFTHGTSEQRVRWFSHGLQSGNLGHLKELFERPYEEL
jgi:uncharacterized protein